MEFLYQIKLVSNQYETYCRPVVAQGIIEKESKKESIIFSLFFCTDDECPSSFWFIYRDKCNKKRV